MHTPPSTRTKDDARKELKEIELKINSEKSLLEKIMKERELAESSFATREQKVINSERELSDVLDRLNRKIESNDTTIREQETRIAENSYKISKGIEDLNMVSSNISSLRETLNKDEEMYSSRIDSLVVAITALQNEEIEKKNEIETINKQINKSNEELDRISCEADALQNSFRKREEYLSERESDLEEKKSAIRTYSVRFHKRFYGKLPDRIIEETTVT